jgi:hypothetical protein
MPYLRINDEGDRTGDGDLLPDATPRPGGGFQYQAATAHFAPAKLAGPAAVVHSMLIERGATRFRATYDGGHDEGFAHADTVWFGAEPKAVEGVTDLLGTKELHARLTEAAGTDSKASHWHNAVKFYREDSAADAVGRALDELAHAMAEALLGGGFGTGEYSLYGAFEVDLSSGKITDDPAAGMPLDMD